MTVALAAAVASSLYMAADTTSRAFRTGSTVSEVEADCQRALNAIARHLETADFALITPKVSAPFNTTWLDYQRVTGYVGGVLQTGPPERIELEFLPTDPDDGVDNDGNGLVDEGRVVWVENSGLWNERRFVLCNWVAGTAEGEDQGNFLDDNGNFLEDERGLSFDFADNLLNIRVTLQRIDADGFPITRSLARTISLRNGAP